MNLKKRFALTTLAAGCLLLAGGLLPGSARAQTGSITGTVTDSLDGSPLPGVNVVIAGTQQGAATDAEGDYEISGLEPGTYDVQASFVGYNAKVVTDVQVSAEEAAQVDFALSSSAVQLDEIVAVGYGTQRREDVTGSVSSVDVDDEDVGFTSSPQELIQGRAAGVSVTRNNGEPGAGATVRIRGGTSINASNDPLYVVDGVPIDNGSIEPGGYGTSRNPLSFLNANDIQSIDILKDAAATAIYGARGANGVVLITTKGGQAGQVQVDYSGSVSSSAMARTLDLLDANEYRSFIQQQVENQALGWEDIDEDDQVDRIRDDDGNGTADVIDQLGSANTDWQDAMTRTAISQQHNLAISGGTESTQYRASVGYADEQGIIISSGQQRLTGQFNADLQTFDNRLRLGANLNAAYLQDDHIPYNETGGFSGAAFQGVIQFNPTLPIRGEDGTFTEYSESTINPVAAARQVDDASKTSRSRGNLTAELDVIESLTAQVNLGAERSTSTRRTYFPQDSPLGEDQGGRAEQDEAQRTSGLIELTSTYNNTFAGVHSFNAVAGYSYQAWVDEGFGADAERFITDYWRFNNLGGGGNEAVLPYSYKNEHTLASVFGRLNYDYDNRYLASLSLRRDGSSRFGENNRWGVFPSASLAWRVSEDFSLPAAVTDLKLRAGYGETGNQEIGNYLALETLAPGFRAVFGQQSFVGVAPNQFANPDLQWEETATFNTGLDYGFLDGRLRGSLDYYRKSTTNLLVALPVPQPAVVSTQVQNVGEVRNAGFEFALEALAIDREDLSLSLNANLATNDNEVVSLGGRDRIFYGSVSGAGLTGVQSYLIQEGLPIGTFYGPEFVGFENGEQIFNDYEDVDGDDVGDNLIGTTTSPGSEDRQVIGNAQSDLTYGLTTRLTWKNWDASLFLRGEYGPEVFNNTALTYEAKTQAQSSNNFLAGALNDPSALSEAPVYSSRWIENGSFLRVDYLTLGYTFSTLPQVQRARLYVRGNNLFVFTPYDGYDPEVRTDNADGLPAVGVDYLNYPKPRSFTVGVDLSF